MKFIRFSTFPAIAGLFLLPVFTSCQHNSPTGPTDSTSTKDGCCHGRITLTATNSVTGHLIDGGSASLYDDFHLISTKPMSSQGTVWDGLCPGHYHVEISMGGTYTESFALDSLGCNGTENPHIVLEAQGTLIAYIPDGTEVLAQSGTLYTNNGTEYIVTATDNVSGDANEGDEITLTIPIETSVPYTINAPPDVSAGISYYDFEDQTQYDGYSAQGSCSITVTQTSPTLIGSFTALVVDPSTSQSIQLTNGSFNATQQ